MSIKSISITSNVDSVMRAVDPSDAEAMAMAVAIKDARESRKQARVARQANQQRHIDALKQARDTLHEAATMARWSGAFQAGLGLGSAALTLTGGLKNVAAQSDRDQADLLKNTIGQGKVSSSASASVTVKNAAQIKDLQSASCRATSAGRWFEASGKALDAGAKLDPFTIRSRDLEVERKDHEITAELAQSRVDDAAETESRARDMETSVKAQLQKLHENRQAVMAAAIRA